MPSNILPGLCFILFCESTYADFFTALEDVGYLLVVRKQMISDIYAYINTENKILSILKRYLELFKMEHELVSKDVSNYFANPLNSFVLIKRLTIDLKYVKAIIKSGTEKAVTMEHERVRYPNLTDLIGAVKGFMAIQEVYQLDVKEIAKGNLNDFVSGMPMTASDCYVLGRILFNELDPDLAIAWMKEALQKYRQEKFPYMFADVDIMEFISYGYVMLGDPKTALQWTRKILRIDPNHSRAKRSVERYKKEIVAEETRIKQEAKLQQEIEQEEITDKNESEMRDEATINDAEEVQTYQALCRGDLDVPVQISSKLTCRYMNENHPFLKIAPIKAEMIYLNPDITLFHDVLSNSEINKIKKMAMPRLGRATVEDALTGKRIPSEDRISKCATMLDAYSVTFTRVSRRIMRMTGLNTENTKETQVANYGIGGYYLPHHDFIQVDKTKEDNRRIATVLFYLSDVPQGGATVFTKLGVRVPPVKGTALFWYNLHASGESDHALLHGGCPVLRGSKWVATKWILQSGQELIKPCKLDYQPDGWDHNIPDPVRKKSGFFAYLYGSQSMHTGAPDPHFYGRVKQTQESLQTLVRQLPGIPACYTRFIPKTNASNSSSNNVTSNLPETIMMPIMSKNYQQRRTFRPPKWYRLLQMKRNQILETENEKVQKKLKLVDEN